MIKRMLLIFVFGLLFFSNEALAQFINLELTIEPELSATVEQTLNFGTQVTNSGPTEINLGDVNMGIFSIRAFRNQQVQIELSYPDFLRNQDPAITDRIPLKLGISYTNNGNNSYQNSTMISGNSDIIKIAGEGYSGNDLWSILYLYVFGEINVGNISNGLYTAEIVLSVEYE